MTLTNRQAAGSSPAPSQPPHAQLGSQNPPPSCPRSLIFRLRASPLDHSVVPAIHADRTCPRNLARPLAIHDPQPALEPQPEALSSSSAPPPRREQTGGCQACGSLPCWPWTSSCGDDERAERAEQPLFAFSFAAQRSGGPRPAAGEPAEQERATAQRGRSGRASCQQGPHVPLPTALAPPTHPSVDDTRTLRSHALRRPKKRPG